MKRSDYKIIDPSFATWKITDDNLYLANIIYTSPDGDVGLNFVFPQTIGKIKAEWFTDNLQIPFGDELNSVISSGHAYDSDWFTRIKKGKVINQRYQEDY